MWSLTKHPSATFSTAQGNNEVIWLVVFAAWSCSPIGDVRETSINRAILTTNCSSCGYEESGAMYFSLKNKYVSACKAGGPKFKQSWMVSRCYRTSHIFKTHTGLHKSFMIYFFFLPIISLWLFFFSPSCCSHFTYSIPVSSVFSPPFFQRIIMLKLMNAVRVDRWEVSKQEKREALSSQGSLSAIWCQQLTHIASIPRSTMSPETSKRRPRERETEGDNSVKSYRGRKTTRKDRHKKTYLFVRKCVSSFQQDIPCCTVYRAPEGSFFMVYVFPVKSHSGL